jgi:hypothetical protein
MPNRILKLSTVKKNPITFLALGNDLSFRDRNGGGSLTATGALRYQPGDGGRVNFSPNPSFEGATNLPTAYQPSATVTRSSDRAYQGSTAIQVVTDGSVSNQGSVGPIVAKGFVGAGMTVYASVWVWAPVGATLTYLVEEYNAAGTYLRTGGGAEFTGTGDWQQVFFTKTLGAGVGLLKHALRTSTTAQAITFYYDAETIEINPVSGTYGQYFDGSAPGCAWADPITGIAGTAHASPSISKAAFWVEEGTTNLATNPSAETNMTNIAASWGGSTCTRTTVAAYIGNTAVDVVTAASGGSGTVYYTAAGQNTIGATYTSSMCLRAATSADVGKTVALRYYVRYTDATDENWGTSTVVTLTDSWQRAVCTATMRADKTTDIVRITALSTNTTAPHFYTDAAQIEEKSYATSYCDGSLGSGYTWAGTAHASASTRASTQVQSTTNVASKVGSLTGSAVMMVYQTDQDRSATQPLLIGTYGTGDWLGSASNQVANQWMMRTKAGALSERNAIATGLTFATWNLLYGAWTMTTVQASINNGTVTTATNRDTPSGTFNSNNINIGYGATTEAINGLIGPLAIFDRPLTQAELTLLQNTDPRYWWDLLGP